MTYHHWPGCPGSSYTRFLVILPMRLLTARITVSTTTTDQGTAHDTYDESIPSFRAPSTFSQRGARSAAPRTPVEPDMVGVDARMPTKCMRRSVFFAIFVGTIQPRSQIVFYSLSHDRPVGGSFVKSRDYFAPLFHCICVQLCHGLLGKSQHRLWRRRRQYTANFISYGQPTEGGLMTHG